MRVLVVGSTGQLASSLAAAAPTVPGLEIVCAGRPSLDLAAPASVGEAIAAHRPAIIVNAAAYTAVDKAETEPALATAINADGADALACAARAAGIALVHLSTDYVFDGSKAQAYVEADATGPTSAYGRSKLEGEQRVRATCARHLILRTAWVHSPYGHNFVKTMLRLAASRPEISVVDDQHGNPTYAPHLASAILQIAAKALRDDGPWGTYHAAGTGDTTWCGLAREVMRVAGDAGGPRASIKAITTAEYPTPARRPANSRLDGALLAKEFGVRLPHWTAGVSECVTALMAEGRRAGGQ